jgi:hypothetical protein
MNINSLEIGSFINIPQPVKCNPIEQKGKWECKGTVMGLCRIEDFIENDNTPYVVVRVKIGQGEIGNGAKLGNPKCIPLEIFTKIAA